MPLNAQSAGTALLRACDSHRAGKSLLDRGDSWSLKVLLQSSGAVHTGMACSCAVHPYYMRTVVSARSQETRLLRACPMVSPGWEKTLLT